MLEKDANSVISYIHYYECCLRGMTSLNFDLVMGSHYTWDGLKKVFAIINQMALKQFDVI